jgi:hypothetical protein
MKELLFGFIIMILALGCLWVFLYVFGWIYIKIQSKMCHRIRIEKDERMLGGALVLVIISLLATFLSLCYYIGQAIVR